jgi:hypothetical protein
MSVIFSQLLAFIQMVFNDGNIQEEMLHCYKGRPEVKTFQRSGLLKTSVPIHKLVSATMDGTPDMTSENAGLTGLHKKDLAFPEVLHTTHQQALYTKAINFHHVKSV